MATQEGFLHLSPIFLREGNIRRVIALCLICPVCELHKCIGETFADTFLQGHMQLGNTFQLREDYPNAILAYKAGYGCTAETTMETKRDVLITLVLCIKYISGATFVLLNG